MTTFVLQYTTVADPEVWNRGGERKGRDWVWGGAMPPAQKIFENFIQK